MKEGWNFVSDIAKDEQWAITRGSATLASVVDQRQYAFSGGSTDLDIGAALRRVLDPTTQFDLYEANEQEWYSRTSSTSSGTPTAYRIAGSQITSGVAELLIEFDPRPSAVITYTIEYQREFAEMSADTDITLMNDNLLLYRASAEMLRSKGQDSRFEEQAFLDLLAKERNKQTNTSQSIVYGARSTPVAGIRPPPGFTVIED